ncbi:MAG: hypothetical protein AAFR97_12875 [Bacteroidota bacterium]
MVVEVEMLAGAGAFGFVLPQVDSINNNETYRHSLKGIDIGLVAISKGGTFIGM